MPALRGTIWPSGLTTYKGVALGDSGSSAVSFVGTSGDVSVGVSPAVPGVGFGGALSGLVGCASRLRRTIWPVTGLILVMGFGFVGCCVGCDAVVVGFIDVSFVGA